MNIIYTSKTSKQLNMNREPLKISKQIKFMKYICLFARKY